MCHIVTVYHCAHQRLDTDKQHQCRDYKRRVQGARQQRNTGLFGCFFPSSSRVIKCTAPAGRRVVLDICPTCRAKKDQANQESLAKSEREARARQEWNGVKNEQIANSRRAEKKARHRCSRCIDEGRHPDPATRSANGGLCCARGLAEFAEVNRTRIPKPHGSARRPVMREERSRGQRPPGPRHMTSQQNVRADASRAAQRYGWNHQQRADDAYLDAGLVKQYMNTPGADPRAIGSGPPIAQPLYKEPGIDWVQWAQAKQGPHGRLPPMPEAPYPIRPLKTRRKQNVGALNRKPVPIRKPTTTTSASSRRTQDRRDSEVSPRTLIPRPSPVSPVSPLTPAWEAENVMADLDRHLTDAMDSWQAQPLAPPAPTFRDIKW